MILKKKYPTSIYLRRKKFMHTTIAEKNNAGSVSRKKARYTEEKNIMHIQYSQRTSNNFRT